MSRRRTERALALLAGLSLVSGALLVACGEDDSSSSSTGGQAGSSSGGAAGASSGGGGSGGTGGTTATGGTGQAGSAGTTSGGSAGAASGGSAGVASGGSAGAASGGSAGAASGGTGGGQSGPSVACGSTACPVATSYCCNHPNQPDECKANGSACTFGVEMACDGPEDCASGQVCCATLFIQGQNQSYTSTACAAACTGKTARVVCGASGTCPTGTTCGTSDLLPPYKDCK
jgi:hypothetical protein